MRMRGCAALAAAAVLATVIAGTAPAVAKGGPEDAERVFVRTSDDGVTIRAYRGSFPAEFGVARRSSCNGAGCPPKECQATGALVIGFSTRAAVSEGWSELYPLGKERMRAVMASGFGTMFDSPAAWVALQTGDRIATVRATFRGGATDEMSPRDHLAVLASPIHGDEVDQIERFGPRGRVVALDRDGAVVARIRFGPSEPLASPPESCQGGLDDSFPAETGAPPADADAARLLVAEAVTTVYRPDSSTLERLAAVEDGTALATVVEIGADRYPEYRDKVGAVVEAVRFVDATHAAVKFGLTVDGQMLVPPGVGLVVLIDGTWLVSRDTFCRLLQLGGVYCPKASKAA